MDTFEEEDLIDLELVSKDSKYIGIEMKTTDKEIEKSCNEQKVLNAVLKVLVDNIEVLICNR